METNLNEPAPAEPITIAYTDGACLGNPGPGGWAYRMDHPDGTSTNDAGHEQHSTNVRMEMVAICAAVQAAEGGQHLLVRTDCMMVVQGVSDWLPGWKKNGFKKSNKKPVANQELWQRLDAALEGKQVQFEHVRSHSGEEGNEAVDKLAYAAAKEAEELIRQELLNGPSGEVVECDWES